MDVSTQIVRRPESQDSLVPLSTHLSSGIRYSVQQRQDRPAHDVVGSPQCIWVSAAQVGRLCAELLLRPRLYIGHHWQKFQQPAHVLHSEGLHN